MDFVFFTALGTIIFALIFTMIKVYDLNDSLNKVVRILELLEKRTNKNTNNANRNGVI